MSKENIEKLRNNSWDTAFHSFGYSYIFEQRIKKYSGYNKKLKFYALVFPALVGLIAFGYKAEYPVVLDIAIIIAIPLTIIQFIFALLAITQEWDNELLYSIEAAIDYNHLYGEFKRLAEFPPVTFEEFDQRFGILNTKYAFRSQQNSKHEVKEKELRKGMKYSLREFKKECIECKIIPTSMESTSCSVCGKYGFFNK